MNFLLQIYFYGLRELQYDFLCLLVHVGLLYSARIQKIIIYLNFQPPINISLGHVLVKDRILLLIADALLVQNLHDATDLVDVIGENTATH